MSSITAIYPPPQTIDTLPAWGDIDHLPYSLDSAIWLTAGVYGLNLSEDAEAEESASGAYIEISASGTISAQGTCFLREVLEASAVSSEAIFAQVIFDGTGDTMAAMSSDSAHGEIFGHGWHDRPVSSGDWVPMADAAQGWHVLHAHNQAWGRAV